MVVKSLVCVVMILVSLSFGQYEKILFLHHSTGRNLVYQGHVRDSIEAYNVAHGDSLEFWDQDYNGAHSLTDHHGGRHPSYDILNNDTYPSGFLWLFRQELDTISPSNTFSHFMADFDVFAFKSCYPACQILPDDTAADLADSSRKSLFNYFRIYRRIRAKCDSIPTRVFVPLTPPPLDPSATTPEQAARARHFATWLAETFLVEDGREHPNIFVFDFFDLLADSDNVLRSEYRRGGGDSHPNRRANETIGPIFARFLIEVVRTYRERTSVEQKPIRPNAPFVFVAPNPFNEVCEVITQRFPGKEIRISIFDINGKFVAKLKPSYSRSWARASWNASGCKTGIYLVVADFGFTRVSNKVLFVK